MTLHPWRRPLAALLAVAVLAVPAGASARTCDDDDEYREPTKEQLDRAAKRALKQKDAVEAKSWLAARADRGMFGIERKTIVRGVDALYAAGAKKVTLAEISDYLNGPGAAQVIVELPADPAARKKVFKAWNDHVFDDDYISLKAKEIGQTYLFAYTDG